MTAPIVPPAQDQQAPQDRAPADTGRPTAAQLRAELLARSLAGRRARPATGAGPGPDATTGPTGATGLGSPVAGPPGPSATGAARTPAPGLGDGTGSGSGSGSEPAELAPGQRQLWFLHQLDPDSTAYSLPLAYRLRGPLDSAALRRACEALAARHEILRTRHVLTAEGPRQLVDPAGPVDWAQTTRTATAGHRDPATGAVASTTADLSTPADTTLAAADAAAVEFTRRWVAEPFDLAGGHPFRARLLRLAPQDHALVLVVPHLACDAMTRPLLLRDLSALYAAALEGRDPARALPAAARYTDYARHLNSRQEGPRAARALDWWRETLDGVTPLDLPTDRPRPAVRDERGAVVPFEVPAPVVRELRELASAENGTLFMVLLSACQALLGRYTAKRDVTVGTAVSARTRPEFQDMAGYAYNTLALRGRWERGTSFRRLLTANRGAVLDAFDHQDTPFDKVADALEPDRDMASTPVFQVMIDLAAGGGANAPELPGLRAEPIEAEGDIARFDLTLHLEERADGSLAGSLEYATALFDAASAQRLAGHYTRLLRAAGERPGCPLDDLDILDAQERALLLTPDLPPAGAVREAGAPAPRPVWRTIEAQAAATPEATAVRYPGGTLSYARLHAEATAHAHRLAQLGIGPEDTVGVLVDRGPDLVAVLLGVWKAGAAYVPIDPEYPDERVRHMLSTTGTRLVIASRRHSDRFAAPDGGATNGTPATGPTGLAGPTEPAGPTGPPTGPTEPTGPAGPAGPTAPTAPAPRVLVVDSARERAARAAADAPLPPAGTLDDLDHLAYVIYTSGSTGQPKGVLISHRGLANYLEWAARSYAPGAPGGAPLFSSVAFDLGVPDLYVPLMTGRPVHLLPQDLDTADLGAALAEGGPYSFVKLTPGHLDLLTSQLSDERIASLARLVIAAGDAFTARLAARWERAAGPDGTRLAAEYGPTEITVGNSAYFLDGPVPTELVPIGRAIPDTTMYVLDDRLRPLPVGVPGEVWIGGVGLARGYAAQPALTAERFVPDPYGPPGARLYRTGDIARVLPDGELDFVSRADHQVKLRGYRVEPGEIEKRLTAHPAVAEAVVLVREDTPGDQQLVAYLVPTPGAEAHSHSPAALRAHLGESLPAYMVPAAHVVLDALPLTANGKLDRRALPAPGRAATAVGEHVAPRDATEATLAAVWARVLGLDAVGVHDNFFDLGGDSIRAVTLVGELRAAGWETSVRDLFEHRTVARLAAHGQQTAAAPDQGGHAPVARFAMLGPEDRAALPADVVDAYPLSLVQAGMLVEMHDVGGENRYHNITSFRIRDELPFDAACFQRAADLIVERHEVMRTSFALAGYSRPLQLVHAGGSMPCLVEDLRELPESEREATLFAFADRDRSELFDLARAPLMRMAVHLLDDESWWLSITECHPVIEGWSYHSQLMELLRAYRALRAGGEPEPAPPTPSVRYADFIAGELRALDSAEDRAHWSRTVRAHEKFEVPAGWAGAADEPDERYRVDVPLETWEPALRALGSRAGVPYKSVLHAAHSKVLSLLTGARAFRGGMVADARPEEAGAERVSGMYLNSVPFPYGRTAATWGDLAREVFAAEVALWPHRRYPMPAMREPGGERHLIGVLFHYLDFHQVDTELIDIMASRDDSPNEFPLVVGTPIRGRLSIASRTRTLSRAHAERLAALYRAVLADMARTGPEGDARGAYPDAAERAGLTGAWEDPDTTTDTLTDTLTDTGTDTAGGVAAHTATVTATVTAGGVAPYVAADTVTEVATGTTGAASPALRVTATGSGEPAEPARPVDVLTAFEAAAAAHPSATALHGAGWSLTYDELDALADRFAHHLRAHGAGPESRVAVLLDRGPDQVAALLGVWKAGAAQMPLDAGTPPARLATLRPDLTVTEAAHDGLLPGPRLLVADVLAGEAPEGPLPARDPERLAYVLWTSGSTGAPKGVEVGHRALARYLDRAVRHYVGAGPGGSAWFTPAGFDLGLPALYAPLMTGRPVRLLPQGHAPGELGRLLRAGAGAGPYAFLGLTPGHLGLLEAQLTGEELGTLAALLVSAGEALPQEQARRLHARVAASGARLRMVAEYGPTEATVAATATPVDPEGGRVLVPLGRPLPGVVLRLLDEELRPVPAGVTGGIWLGGPQLARGYADLPAETALAFRPDPYGAPGARLYRTGDRARLLADGTLEFTGRADERLKIRGHRVEPGEIEAALGADPAVREALVVAVPAADGGQRLAAWVVPAEGHTVTVPALRDRLRALLPPALIPATVTALPALPLTAHGKRDTAALTATAAARTATGTDVPYTAPRTPRERALCAVWAEVLGLDRVGVHDHFRDLGGDSLLLAPMLLAARRAGIALDLATALRHPTVARLAAAPHSPKEG